MGSHFFICIFMYFLCGRNARLPIDLTAGIPALIFSSFPLLTVFSCQLLSISPLFFDLLPFTVLSYHLLSSPPLSSHLFSCSPFSSSALVFDLLYSPALSSPLLHCPLISSLLYPCWRIHSYQVTLCTTIASFPLKGSDVLRWTAAPSLFVSSGLRPWGYL